MPEVKELAEKLGEVKIEYYGPESHGIVRLTKHLTPESIEALARVAVEFEGIDYAEKIWARGFDIRLVKRNDGSVLVDVECVVETEHGVMRCDNYLIVRAIMPTLSEALAAADYYIENGQAYVEFLPDKKLREKETGDIYQQTTLSEQVNRYINEENL